MSVEKPPHRPTQREHQAAVDLSIPTDDDYAAAMLELAGRSFSDRKYDAAISILKGIAVVRPEDERVYEALGAVYIALDQTEDAEACYGLALELNSDSLLALLHLGEIAMRVRKDTETAKRHLDRVVKLDPDGEFEKRAQRTLDRISAAST